MSVICNLDIWPWRSAVSDMLMPLGDGLAFGRPVLISRVSLHTLSALQNNRTSCSEYLKDSKKRLTSTSRIMTV